MKMGIFFCIHAEIKNTPEYLFTLKTVYQILLSVNNKNETKRAIFYTQKIYINSINSLQILHIKYVCQFKKKVCISACFQEASMDFTLFLHLFFFCLMLVGEHFPTVKNMIYINIYVIFSSQK